MNKIRIEQFIKEKKIHFQVNEESFWFKGNLVAFKKKLIKSKYLSKREIQSYIDLAKSLIQVKKIKIIKSKYPSKKEIQSYIDLAERKNLSCKSSKNKSKNFFK